MPIRYLPYSGDNSGASNATWRTQQQKKADLADLSRSVQSYAIMGGQAMILDAIEAVGNGIYDSLRNAADAMNAKVVKDRSTTFTEIHRRVAEDALITMVNVWPKGHTDPYRANASGKLHREAGGRLRRAVGNTNMYRVSRDGIDFINPVWLDSQAKQWYRINFGAGPEGANTPAPKTQKVVIFGQVIPGDFGLIGFGPSKQFFLPPGYWFEKGRPEKAVPWGSSRGDWFGLRRSGLNVVSPKARGLISKQPRPSIGFAGNNALQVGVNRILVTLPHEYDKLVAGWIKEFKDYATRRGPFTSQPVTGRVKDIQRFGAVLNRTIRDREKLYEYRTGTSYANTGLRQFGGEEPF